MWVDHCDLSSDLDHSEGYYKSLLSIGDGSDWMTVTKTLFHDSPVAAVVGGDAGLDAGKLHLTFTENHWRNVNSTPSFSFGTGHLFKYV